MKIKLIKIQFCKLHVGRLILLAAHVEQLSGLTVQLLHYSEQ